MQTADSEFQTVGDEKRSQFWQMIYREVEHQMNGVTEQCCVSGYGG